jgi:hypothetical protein
MREMRWRSLGESPAQGSSSSSSLGRDSSASASSSCRRSPYESSFTRSDARFSSPTSASALRALCSRSAKAPTARCRTHLRRSVPRMARAMFSSTGSSRKTLEIWKVRPMPRTLRRGSSSGVTSAPKRPTRPALGRSVPEMQWKSVVLPAPLGPISTRRSPGATLSDTLSTARKPPKSFTSPSTRSASLMACAGCAIPGPSARGAPTGWSR